MREHKSKIDLILKAFGAAVWAIMPEKLEAMIEVLELRSRGLAFDPMEIEARLGARGRKPRGTTRGIAVIPVLGTISNRMGIMSEASGSASLEAFRAQFRDALTAPSVDAILLDIDSPGGNVEGVTETAMEIFRSRGEKPIVASANTLAASAAYWLAAAADELVASPSALVGSVGVIGVHTDRSEAETKAGIKTTLITAGRYKAEGMGPLTDDALAALQERVDETYDVFVNDVARGRGTRASVVKREYGEGRVVTAKRALAAGMIDGIETFDQTLARLAAGKKLKARGGLRAEEVAQLEERDLRHRRSRINALA